MMGTQVIQNERYAITIDSLKKVISVKDAELNIWENINPVILEKYLVTSSEMILDDMNGDYKLKIVPPASSSLEQYELIYDTNYRIKLIKMGLEKEELNEDGKTTFIIHPKIIFRFYNYKNGDAINRNEFLTESYLITGNKIEPKKEYSNYKFFDLRVKDKYKN